jgi:hypothetical protein
MRASVRLYSTLPPLLVSVLLCVPVLAQVPTFGTIRGYVKDQQGAVLDGVRVTASSPEASHDQETSSAADGRYRLTELQPGTYTVTAERAGFARVVQENVRVGAGQTLGLDIVLPISGVTEAIDVKHDPPMLEIARPGQTINIAGDFHRAVPLTRNGEWSQFMQMIPGVVGIAGSSLENYNFHGADVSSQVVQLDGADALPAAQHIISRTQLSLEAISDIQVKTSVADASAPLGLGVVASVVTHSGTNQLRGTGALTYQGLHWNATNVVGGTTAATSLMQPDVSVGGPVIRDRTWFFGSYQYLDSDRGISRTSQQIANLTKAKSDFRPFDNQTNGSFALGKVTQHYAQQELTFLAQYDKYPIYNASPVDTARFFAFKPGGPLYSTRLTSVFAPSLVGQFAVTYNGKGDDNALSNPSESSRVIYERVVPSGAGLAGVNMLGRLNNAGFSKGSLYSKWVLSADFTHTRTIGSRSHELRFGVYVQRNGEGERVDLANGGAYLSEEVLRDPSRPELGSIPFHLSVGSPDQLPISNERAHDVAVYFQDLWLVHPRVSIAAGVRIDAIGRQDVLFTARVQGSVDVGPRLGTTVALDENKRNIVHGAVGRIHDTLASTRASFGTSTFTSTDSYDTDLDGKVDVTLVTPGATQASTNRRYDPNFHQPHVDETTIGYRRQLWRQTSVDVTWVNRRFRDAVTTVETNGIYDGVVFVGYRDVSQSSILLLTNNTWNGINYNALAVDMLKRWSRGQLLASYARQWQHIAGTWQPNDPSSFLQPEIFADDRVNPQFWRDHTVRAGGTWNAGWGIHVAADYTLQSGVWSGPITTRIAAPDTRFGPATVTLSNGRVVPNPLATTARYAYASRGAGQLRTDALHVLNLRLTKELTMPFGTMQLSGSVFNLPNAASYQYFLDTNLKSSSFGAVTSLQPPRAGQVAIRVTF